MIRFFAILVILIGMPAAAQDEFVFGMVLVGAQNDQGWSQAHYEGGLYVEAHVPGARMVVFDRLNPTDAPEVTLLDVVTNMVDEGAQVIFTTSDQFEADTTEVASNFPDVVFINISGDDVLTGEAPPNVGNVMGQMEWGKLIAGCAAALTTETGHIGYLGASISFYTRRLAASAYLGARYCYEAYRNNNPDTLRFSVVWIGNAADPGEEANTFFDDGADVVISGVNSTEVIRAADRRAGDSVYAIPYDYAVACDTAPNVCLGVPYFNWGPAYRDIVQRVMEDTWEQSWDWNEPDWRNINNLDRSAVGFVSGPGLSRENARRLDDFIDDLSAYATNPFIPDSFALWGGPLNLQDGSPLVRPGVLADPLDVWYLNQLLQGMTGASQ